MSGGDLRPAAPPVDSAATRRRRTPAAAAGTALDKVAAAVIIRPIVSVLFVTLAQEGGAGCEMPQLSF